VFDTLLVGLINGNTYALIALGVSLIIGTSNVINFAHGSLFALGATIGCCLAAAAGWPLWLDTLGVLAIAGGLGFLVHTVAVRPFTQAAPIPALLATLTVSMIFDNASQLDPVQSVAFFSWANRLMLTLGEPLLQPVKKA
jgi:branched-chain amino acid transport system permease protein